MPRFRSGTPDTAEPLVATKKNENETLRTYNNYVSSSNDE